MNLIFRLLYVWMISFFRERLPVGLAVSKLHLVTLPNDLDINLHMNNGRFLTICDLNRVDLFIRTGLLKVMLKEGWMPIVTEHTMQYKKPLKIFRRFEVIAEITHWDEKSFFMTHRFMIQDKLIAEGTSKGVIKGREGIVPPEEVIRRVKISRRETIINGENNYD